MPTSAAIPLEKLIARYGERRLGLVKFEPSKTGKGLRQPRGDEVDLPLDIGIQASGQNIANYWHLAVHPGKEDGDNPPFVIFDVDMRDKDGKYGATNAVDAMRVWYEESGVSMDEDVFRVRTPSSHEGVNSEHHKWRYSRAQWEKIKADGRKLNGYVVGGVQFRSHGLFVLEGTPARRRGTREDGKPATGNYRYELVNNRAGERGSIPELPDTLFDKLYPPSKAAEWKGRPIPDIPACPKIAAFMAKLLTPHIGVSAREFREHYALRVPEFRHMARVDVKCGLGGTKEAEDAYIEWVKRDEDWRRDADIDGTADINSPAGEVEERRKFGNAKKHGAAKENPQALFAAVNPRVVSALEDSLDLKPTNRNGNETATKSAGMGVQVAAVLREKNAVVYYDRTLWEWMCTRLRSNGLRETVPLFKENDSGESDTAWCTREFNAYVRLPSGPKGELKPVLPPAKSPNDRQAKLELFLDDLRTFHPEEFVRTPRADWIEENHARWLEAGRPNAGKLDTWMLELYDGKWEVTDGKPRQSELDRAMLAIMSEKLLTNLVSSLCNPNHRPRWLFVLTGAQKIGKSSLARNICPFDSWYGDSTATNLQEFLEESRGKSFMELGDVAKLLSTPIYRALFNVNKTVAKRKAYGRVAQDWSVNFTTLLTLNPLDSQCFSHTDQLSRFIVASVSAKAEPQDSAAYLNKYRNCLLAEAYERVVVNDGGFDLDKDAEEKCYASAIRFRKIPAVYRGVAKLTLKPEEEQRASGIKEENIVKPGMLLEDLATQFNDILSGRSRGNDPELDSEAVRYVCETVANARFGLEHEGYPLLEGYKTF